LLIFVISTNCALIISKTTFCASLLGLKTPDLYLYLDSTLLNMNSQKKYKQSETDKQTNKQIQSDSDVISLTNKE